MTEGSLNVSYKIAVILPSRGLIFSQTAEEIINNLHSAGIPYKIFFSHRKPIPECFEAPTLRALKDEAVTHLWFVEDDMVFPNNTLQQMVGMNKAVVTADYPVNKGGRGAVFRDKGKKILFCGTGCLLVKREVFDELKKPYFRTDIRWTIKNMGNHIKLTKTETGDLEGYGYHDVNFCMNLQWLNIPIHCIDTQLAQRKLVALGQAGTNNGAHQIEVWDKVVKDQLLKKVQSWPITPTGSLVEIVTPTGVVNCTPAHARKLIKKKLGKRPPKRYSTIDWNNQ
jgi:hypothetical protein